MHLCSGQVLFHTHNMSTNSINAQLGEGARVQHGDAAAAPGEAALTFDEKLDHILKWCVCYTFVHVRTRSSNTRDSNTPGHSRESWGRRVGRFSIKLHPAFRGLLRLPGAHKFRFFSVRSRTYSRTHTRCAHIGMTSGHLYSAGTCSRACRP